MKRKREEEKKNSEVIHGIFRFLFFIFFIKKVL